MFPGRRTDKPPFRRKAESIQIKPQFLIRICFRQRLAAVMGMECTPFFTMIILIPHITRQDKLLPGILLMSSHFQMVHFTIGKLYVPAITVIFQTRHIGNSMCTGKETCLLKYIGHGIIRLIPFLLVLGKEIDITLPPCRILQPTTMDRHLLSQVDYRIRRDTVIPESLFGITYLRIPGILFDAQHQRSAESLVDRLSQKRYITKQHILCRNLYGSNVNHSAHGIAAIKQRSRAFHHIHGIYIESIEFQTMICSPLLPFLFDTILQYGNPVKAHSPDHRFRKSRTDIHSLHARNILHRLHKVTCKMFPQEIPVSHFKGKCSLLILKLLVGFRHHYFRQSYITD